jgi:hypothetical protein
MTYAFIVIQAIKLHGMKKSFQEKDEADVTTLTHHCHIAGLSS